MSKEWPNTPFDTRHSFHLLNNK